MSGGSSPYHLRLNKSIERNLFIDLLKIVGRHTNISDYWYVGFAGPFSEDFKTIHSALRITKMKSVEIEENVYKRQIFNYSPSFISYMHCSFADLLRGDFYQSDRGTTNAITWLDYANAHETRAQLTEFQTLVASSIPLDVIKITLNANVACVTGNNTAAKLQCFKHRMGALCPADISEENLTQKDYPETLMRCIKLSLDGLPGKRDNYFHPLASFTYQDTNNLMLTVTGIILENSDASTIEKFEKSSRVNHWKFCNTQWSAPRRIRVPSLSIKERIELDSMLPCDDPRRGEILRNALNFYPDEKEQGGILSLENYADYYRAYSLFTKVVV